MKNEKEKLINEHFLFNIEDARDTLDRILRYSDNFDMKSTIILGVCGFILTIFINESGFSYFYSIMEHAKELHNYLYPLLIIAGAIFFSGIFSLLSIITVKVKTDNENSKIYFNDIAKYDNFEQYFISLFSQKTSLLNDLIFQIYINAKICKKKNIKFKIGILFTFLGGYFFILFIAVGYRYYIKL